MNNNVRVLIADDNREFADITGEYLTNSDIKVLGIARDGLEAIEKTIEYSPDILILDMIMPHLDGLEVIKRLKHNYMQKSLKIILISSCKTPKIVNHALNTGADYFLKKPIFFDDLVDICKGFAINGKNTYAGFDMEDLYTKRKIEYIAAWKKVDEVLRNTFTFHEDYMKNSVSYHLLVQSIYATVYEQEILYLLSSIDDLLIDNIFDIKITGLVKDFMKYLYIYFKEVLGLFRNPEDGDTEDIIGSKIKAAAEMLLDTEKNSIERFTGCKFADAKCKYDYLKLIYKISNKIIRLEQ